MDHSFIYLIHILFAGPLLIYSGYIGKQLSEKCNDDTKVDVFMTLLLVGIVVVIYHSYKFLKIKGLIHY